MVEGTRRWARLEEGEHGDGGDGRGDVLLLLLHAADAFTRACGSLVQEEVLGLAVVAAAANARESEEGD